MFIKKTEMKDINNCLSKNGNTVFISKTQKTIWLNSKEIFNGKENLFATITGKDFFIFGDSEKLFSGKIQENNFQITERNIFTNTYSDKGIVMYENRVFVEESSNYRYDAIYHEYQTGFNKAILNQMSGVYEFLYDNEGKAIIKDITTLKSLSLETGEYLWEINLVVEGDTDPRIKQVLGISGDVLVVFTFGSTLVGIDVHTGEILWSILPKGFYPSGFTGMAWCWHLADDYLYLLRHQYYLRINLSNQQLEILWQVPADTLEFEDCSYTEDHIYFMAIKKKSNIFNTSILGVFDRKALKIVWQHDQPIYSSQPPQSDGNKLYCLDTGGTLHIFEKEV